MKAIAKHTLKTKRETLISGNRSLSFDKLYGMQTDNRAISRIFHILVIAFRTVNYRYARQRPLL